MKSGSIEKCLPLLCTSLNTFSRSDGSVVRCRYVSGYYGNIVCEYPDNWAPFVLLMILVLCITSFTKVRF